MARETSGLVAVFDSRTVSKAVSFRFVSFRFVPFHVIPFNMPKANAGKSRIARVWQAITCEKVGEEWQMVATVQLEVLKAIAVFEASVQSHGTSPSRVLEQNRTKTKRNGTKR